MGLLGTEDFDPATQGLLAAAFKGLQASGPSRMPVSLGQVIGAGGEAGMGAYNDSRKLNAELAFRKQQMDLQKEHADLYKAQVAAAERKAKMDEDRQRLLMSIYGVGGANPQMAAGAAVGDVGPTVTNAARPAQSSKGPTLEQLGVLAASGVDIKPHLELWKQLNPEMDVLPNGMVVDKRKLTPGTSMPNVNQSNGLATQIQPGPNGTFTQTAVPGALDLLGKVEDIKQRSNANYGSPVTITPPGGNPRMVTPAQFSDIARGGAPSGFDTFGPNRERFDAAVKADMEKNGIKEARFVYGNPATGEVADKGVFGKSAGAGVEVQSPSVTKATEGLNENWIKQSFNPAIEQGRAATSQIANLDALKNIDMKTGWSTEAKAAAANVLTGLGIAPKNAELYATKAQQFQSVAMTKLWETLNNAKGPQTEGDANRAKATFAQLGNTPEANQFIVDFARAVANREKRRADFYNEALPVARQMGDLTAIDRSWSKIDGSIWNDPVLKRWAK